MNELIDLRCLLYIDINMVLKCFMNFIVGFLWIVLLFKMLFPVISLKLYNQ